MTKTENSKWLTPHMKDGWVSINDALPPYGVTVDVWLPKFATVDVIDSYIENDYVLKTFNIGVGTDIAFQDRYMHELGLYELSSKLSDGHVTHWRYPKVVKGSSNADHHTANKRHKKIIKKLQKRLAEEQRDAKRLTMLLMASRANTTGVLKDLIDSELSVMRYRYHITHESIERIR